MAISLIRTVILYFTVVFIFRLMGKRQIGELQPSELVLAIMVSDLATVPMQSTGIPLTSGIIPILILMIGEIVLSFIAQKSNGFRRILTGSPSLVISKGKIVVSELKRLRFNIDDLFEELRSNGYPNILDVEYAILETNGQISVIPKSYARSATPADLNIQTQPATLSRNIIKDGTVDWTNLKEIGRDENWLNQQLKANHVKHPSEVFLMNADCDDKIFFQKKEKNNKPRKNYQ